MAGSRFALRSTTRLLALCALLALVPLALLAFLSVQLATDAVEDNAEAQVRSNAAMAVNTFQSAMTGVASAVQSSAQRPALRAASTNPAFDQAALQRQLLALKKGQNSVATAFLATSDGHLRGIVPFTPALLGADLGASDWFRGAKTKG
jgi:nitrogen fixation/metabolism regulation signal transduction histidine kinase